jgi:plastocyanin
MARVFRSPASNWSFAVALGLLAVLTACGGGRSDTTLSPSPSGNVTVISGSTGSTGPSGATVTMTSAGVSPATVTISVGQSVTFVNSDTRSHEIASDPHPIHGSCPSIERGLGTIGPGQTKLTQGFAGVGTCTYHDHLDDTNQNFHGSIRIQ